MTPEGRGGESRSGPPPQVRWVTPGSLTHRSSSCAFERTCEGKHATRDEAFDAVIAGGEVITQWYRVGDVTEQPPAAPGAGACCGPGNELGLSARMPRVLP